MALIGDFEVAVKKANPNAEPDQFKLNGELFTVSGKDLTIVFGRFAKAATSGLDTAEMEGAAAMIDLLTGVVVEEDAQRLLRTVDGADIEEVFKVVSAVIEAQTGRPTVQPSDSSDGLSRTGESSKALSAFGAVPPIQLDPRVRELQPVEQAALSLVG